jgi:hypothetical protein
MTDSNLKNIHRLDAVYMWLAAFAETNPAALDAITVIIAVRQSIAKGTRLDGVFSSREETISSLLPSPQEVAEAILEDLNNE